MTSQAVADITDVVPQETARIEIMKPGGIEGTGWFIDLCGPSHPKAISWADERARRDLRKAAQLEQQQANGRKVKVDVKEPDEARRENVGWLASRITGWTPVKIGFLSPEPIAYSDEAVFKVFMDTRMGWAYAQVLDALNEDKAFTKASAKS